MFYPPFFILLFQFIYIVIHKQEIQIAKSNQIKSNQTNPIQSNPKKDILVLYI